MSLIQQRNLCCQNQKAYTVTCKEETFDVCISCFEIEQKSKNYPDTLIKPFQRNTIKIICNSCGNDVTKDMGCESCHPVSKEESN
jgi:hypothetical protein